MGKNTSISLGPHFEDFISQKVKSGRFGSASEVIRTALRLLEDQEAKIQALRDAITEGQESGYIDDYDPKKHLEEIHKKYLK